VTVGAAFLLLLGRLWQLEVLSGEHYYRKSADNFVKEVELPAPRGVIRDTHGEILADNRPSYQVTVTPRFFTDDALQRLARRLRLDDDAVDALKAKLANRHGLDRFRPVMVFDEVSRDDMGVITESALELPGVAVTDGARRSYPRGALSAHVLGYMSQVTPDDLVTKKEQGYRLGDYIGRAGLERQWESYLRGKVGSERIVVDAKGQRKPEVETEELLGGPQRTEPQPGLDVVVTIDLGLQVGVEKALSHWASAAAVVVDVQTGRILAMASQPDYDPNRLSGRMSSAEAAQLLGSETRPLFDKTVAGTYFPGSTFKIVPMIAALEDHSVDPDERLHCHGAIQYGHRWFHCVEPHGIVNLHQALSQSCNVYFYGLGEKVGLDRMAEEAADLGLGAPTGLGINGELSGFIPTTEWYKAHGGYQKGFALSTAIGQGSVKVTLLQMAMAYAALANGGHLYVPQLVERIEAPGGKVIQDFPPRLRRDLHASPDTLRRLRAGLTDAVNDEKGTSFGSRLLGMDVAGKTGTAQVGDHRVKESEGSLSNDHGWFASFGPAQKPEIAVVVLIEHGGFGAKSATPVAMEIYRRWFSLHHGLDLTALTPKPGKHRR